MAENGNIGWKAVPPGSDFLYVGDDVRFLQPGTVQRLQDIAYSDPQIGLLSPVVVGGIGNVLQRASRYAPGATELAFTEEGLKFVCVYFKREVVEKVGYMDETFQGYGFDDDDYCRSVQAAGYRLGITPQVVVEHQHATATFMRNTGGDYTPLSESIFGQRQDLRREMAGQVMDATVAYDGRAVEFHDVDPADYIGKILLGGEWYEMPNLEFIRGLQVGGTYVDAGAYIGTYSVFFSLFCPAERVYSFEPQPDIYDKLCWNLGLNGASNCVPLNMGLADTTRRCAPRVVIHGKEVSGEAARGNRGGAWLLPGDEIDVVTLDSLGIPDVRLVKIDVEGLELKVHRRGEKDAPRRAAPLRGDVDEVAEQRPRRELQQGQGDRDAPVRRLRPRPRAGGERVPLPEG